MPCSLSHSLHEQTSSLLSSLKTLISPTPKPRRLHLPSSLLLSSLSQKPNPNPRYGEILTDNTGSTTERPNQNDDAVEESHKNALRCCIGLGLNGLDKVLLRESRGSSTKRSFSQLQKEELLNSWSKEVIWIKCLQMRLNNCQGTRDLIYWTKFLMAIFYYLISDWIIVVYMGLEPKGNTWTPT